MKLFAPATCCIVPPTLFNIVPLMTSTYPHLRLSPYLCSCEANKFSSFFRRRTCTSIWFIKSVAELWHWRRVTTTTSTSTTTCGNAPANCAGNFQLGLIWSKSKPNGHAHRWPLSFESCLCVTHIRALELDSSPHRQTSWSAALPHLGDTDTPKGDWQPGDYSALAWAQVQSRLCCIIHALRRQAHRHRPHPHPHPRPRNGNGIHERR